MSFTEPEEAHGGLLKKIGAIAVGLFAFFVVKAIVSGGFAFVNNSEWKAERELEAAVRNEPNMAPVFLAMEDAFPEDYTRFKSTTIENARGGMNQTEAFLAGRAFMQQFIASQTANFAQGPDDLILQVRDHNIEVIEGLAAESPQLCAHFAMSGLGPGDKPSNESMKRIGQAAAAHIRTAAAGRDNPVSRPEPTEEDFTLYLDALTSAGITDNELEAFLNGVPSLTEKPIQRQCELGLMVYRSLAKLPPEASARLSAAILAPQG